MTITGFLVVWAAGAVMLLAIWAARGTKKESLGSVLSFCVFWPAWVVTIGVFVIGLIVTTND